MLEPSIIQLGNEQASGSLERDDWLVMDRRLIPVDAEIRRMKLGNQELQESKFTLGQHEAD